TAGHVSNRPGRDIKVILPDGRQVSARTLGANYGIDSGLVKITEPGKWPHAELGDSSRLKLGQWCLVTGHPGGFDKGRTAPLRVGRILELSPGTIVTDCTLVGGDSGGPLFDADGHVIGINSRIGNELYANLHVPSNAFRDAWDRLARGDVWGGRRPNAPYIGVAADRRVEEAKIGEIIEGSPAEEAGLKVGDVIVSFGGKPTATFDALISAVARREPGDRVPLEIRRDGQTIRVEVVLTRYGE
ncbi:MAG: S1C family serine protease, partial [Planctomycetia bacterium]|nr:S1C family serine protease [Planctomycetia bacterium]